jgi:hypothetical protein
MSTGMKNYIFSFAIHCSWYNLDICAWFTSDCFHHHVQTFFKRTFLYSVSVQRFDIIKKAIFREKQTPPTTLSITRSSTCRADG